MSRTVTYTALVLRCRPSGESNNEVTLLTAEEGLIKATVFGGPKSKLRAHSAPYNSGQIWIYRDKSKEYGKLSDFDVRSWRPGLRELYERTMTAACIAESILSSHGGGGDWGTALELAIDTLDTLENANEELCAFLLVHFLWRWAGFLGIQPNLGCCVNCAEAVKDGVVWFNIRESAAFCTDCTKELSDNRSESKETGLILLNPGCRRWLSAAGGIEPAQLHRYSMDRKSFNEAKSLVTAILSQAFGKKPIICEWQ
ncbi:MAG: recombination protein O N-terminal domain-containing protein [Treponema sp.]|nr:recombination protein O N-terminal domain-containing protein [Treponema sp.]